MSWKRRSVLSLQEQLRACQVRKMEKHLGQREYHEQNMETALESGHHLLIWNEKSRAGRVLIRTRQYEATSEGQHQGSTCLCLPRGNLAQGWLIFIFLRETTNLDIYVKPLDF